MTPEERQAALEAGVAVALTGATIREAARAVGMPRATLHEAIRRYQDTPDAIKAAADRLAAAHLTIAEQAAERLYGRIDALDDALLIRAYGVASDKVAVHQGWGRNDNDHASGGTQALELLSKLLDAKGTLTLTVSSAPTEPKADPTDVLDLDPKGDLTS